MWSDQETSAVAKPLQKCLANSSPKIAWLLANCLMMVNRCSMWRSCIRMHDSSIAYSGFTYMSLTQNVGHHDIHFFMEYCGFILLSDLLTWPGWSIIWLVSWSVSQLYLGGKNCSMTCNILFSNIYAWSPATPPPTHTKSWLAVLQTFYLANNWLNKEEFLLIAVAALA